MTTQRLEQIRMQHRNYRQAIKPTDSLGSTLIDAIPELLDRLAAAQALAEAAAAEVLELALDMRTTSKPMFERAKASARSDRLKAALAAWNSAQGGQ